MDGATKMIRIAIITALAALAVATEPVPAKACSSCVVVDRGDTSSNDNNATITLYVEGMMKSRSGAT